MSDSNSWDQGFQQAVGQSPAARPADPFEEAYQRVYGRPSTPAAPSGTASLQPTQTPSGRTLDKAATAEKADAAANGTEGETSVGDYAWDGAVGVAAGAEGFAKSLGKLTNDVAGLFGMEFTDDSTFASKIHTKTWLGGLTSGLTQFALGFVPALGLAGRVGAAVGVGSKFVQGLAAGAAADFIGFTEKQERLSNLIEQFPAARNPITAYLQSKPDDNWAEGRLKGALEGMGLGVILEPAMIALRGFRGQLLAKTAGNKEAFAKVGAETEAALIEHLNKAAPAANVAENAAGAAAAATGEGADKLSSTAGKLGAEYLRNGVPDGLVDKIVNHITTADEPFEVALDKAVQTHVNYDRLVTSEDVAGLQKLAQNVADAYVLKAGRGTLKLDAVADTAKELAETFGENPKLFTAAIAADEKSVSGMAERLVSYRIMRNTVGQALVSTANRWLARIGDEVGGEGLKQLTTLSRSFMDLHRSVQVIQTEGARIPSFGRVLAGTADEFNPDALAKLVEKTMAGGNGPKAAEQLARTIVASDGDPKSLLTLFDSLAGSVGRRAANTLVEIHTNAILSGLNTSAANFLSGIYSTAILPAERIIGGAWQGNASVMKTGFRMYSNILASFLDWTHLSAAASRISDQYGSSGGRAMQAFLKEQPLLDHLTDFNPTHAITASNYGLSEGSALGSAVNYLGKAVRMPTRFMAGMDDLFKNVNYRAYVRDEGMRLAEQAGVADGAEFGRFVDNHITKAFGPNGEALNDAALSYAKAATFQNDLIEGTIGKGVQNFVSEHPMLRLIVPFVKTPTNIFRRAWQMTPGLNMLQSEFRQMAMSADPIERATAAGRTALGGMFWTLGIGAASAGRLTGGGPSNPDERNNLINSGWQPYSVTYTGADGNKQYVSFKKLEPYGYFLGLAADWADAMGQVGDADADKTGTALMYALAKNLTSKTYFTGITDLVNALAQPDHRLDHFLNSFAGSWVPTIVAKASDDDYMRDARGMMDAIVRRLPGFSEELPPSRNLFGEPVKVPQGYLPFGAEGTAAARQVSPFAFSSQVDYAAKRELANLQYGFKKPSRSFQGFDLTGFHLPTGQDAYDRLQELHGSVQIGGKTMGQSLNDLVTSQRYQSMRMPDRHGDETNPRVLAVNQLLAAYRERALGQVLSEYPAIGQAIRAYQAQARGAAPGNPSPVLAALKVQ